MTGAPAARLGLTDRGRIADGLAADLVVFDPATVRSLATYEEPRQYPEGIPYVFVNGVAVVDGGGAHRRDPRAAPSAADWPSRPVRLALTPPGARSQPCPTFDGDAPA